jgi:hypothetical protein
MLGATPFPYLQTIVWIRTSDPAVRRARHDKDTAWHGHNGLVVPVGAQACMHDAVPRPCIMTCYY